MTDSCITCKLHKRNAAQHSHLYTNQSEQRVFEISAMVKLWLKESTATKSL